MSRVFMAVIFGVLVSTFGAMGQDWIGFHGLERQGIHDTASSLDWSGRIDTNWKTPIRGFGFSSPVVTQDKIYLTTAYETAKGSRVKTLVAFSSLVLAWGLFVITTILAIRAAANEWSGRLILFNGVRVFLLMAVVLLVLEMCLFAQGLFNLEYSIVRSWKIGTAVSSLSLFMALLLAPRQTLPSLIFAVAATLLSVFAYVLMPKREAFLDFHTAEGMISTGVVLAPALVAWAVCLTWLLARKTFPQPEPSLPQASMRSRFIRTALCCGLPVIITIGVFWGLVQRMLSIKNSWIWHAPDEPPLIVRFEPALGWSFFILSAVLSVVAIVIGSLILFKRPLVRRRLLRWGAYVSVLLGLSCFLWFDSFPSKRQVAYAVVCLDKKTGAIERLTEVGYSATLHDYKGANSHATPTIAVGTDGLCAYFGSGGLFGLDREGKVRWKVQNAEFDSPFGVGHSPVVADNIVILANDNESYPAAQKTLESHIIAFSLKDGRELWRQKRERSQPGSAGFSTPIVRTIRGQKTILMRGWEDLTAYDLHTGKILWTIRLKHSGNFLVAGLVTDDKRVYVLDGVRAKALDLDALAEGREATVWMVQAPGEKIGSPVLIDGFLFFATDTGVAFCINADKGNLEWRQKLGGRFFSSVVTHGNSLVFANEAGDLSVVARDRAFKMVTQTNLGDKIYATPIPQADGVLVRGATNLYYLKPVQTVAASSAAPNK